MQGVVLFTAISESHHVGQFSRSEAPEAVEQIHEDKERRVE
jgi:hypothetical protein